jgi:hypothetical protein
MNMFAISMSSSGKAPSVRSYAVVNDLDVALLAGDTCDADTPM